MQAPASTRLEMFSTIEGWKASGLSQKTYCLKHSVPYYVFHYWYKVYRDEKSEPGTSKPAFVPVRVDGAPSVRPLMELILPGGKRLVFHHQPSVDFLKALL
jgi:hypothetical protein